MAATHSLDLESSSSQYASIADASCPNLEISGSQTWECWVKLESLPAANMAFMGKSESTAAGWAGLYYNTGTPNTFRFHLHGLTTSSLIGSIATPVAGVWTHVAGVYDGSTLKIYINGELDNSTAASGNHTDSNGNFAIGRLGVYTLNWYYDGLIRNARVWNVARTQQQIRDNMNVDIPVGTGLQGNWILNNSYTDSSANGYTLTASGSPVFSTTYPDAIDLVENKTFTKKHKITVQHTQVAGSANLSDVPIVFTESNFLSDIFTNSQGSEINTNNIINKSGLVAYYKMDSNFNDSSGNGLNLTATGTPADVTGKFGNAKQFDNSAMWATSSSASFAFSSAMSISGWIKLDTINQYSYIASRRISAGGDKGWWFGVDSANKLNMFCAGVGVATTTQTLTTGVWYHVAGVYDGATVKAYINAVPASIAGTGNIGNPTTSMYVGANSNNTAERFPGTIDDLAFFSTALSQAEIEQIYKGGADLRFSSDIDGKTRLAHEIVSFDKGTSKAEVWVKANTLDFDDNTDIYVHYGNATASALDENEAFGKHQVWGENWEGVWHLESSSVDSSKNSNDGTDTSVSYGASYGKIKQGASFNGSTSLINAGTSASLRLQTLTFLAWVDHTPGAYQGIIGPSASNGADFRIENTDKIQLLKSGAVGFGPSSGTLGTGFNHAGVTYNGSSFVYYINGSASGSGTNAQTFSYTGNFQLGSTDGGGAYKLNGYLDQVMVYSGVLSADYIATLYNNQNSPSTFAIPSSLAGGSFLLNFV